ncbi:MAG: hypothetical protein ABR581_08030 [Thermoleophilaceae bacterium]
MEPRRTSEADPRQPWEGFAEAPPRAGRGPDLAALFVFLDAVRSAIPRELEGRFNAMLRELLLTLRSLIDWYLERLDRPARAPQVEDIPID